MKKQIAFIAGVFVLITVLGDILLFGKHSSPRQLIPSNISNPRTPALQKFAGIPTKYVGMLPCAGCSGLKTQLILYRTTPSNTSGFYDLQTTEIGTNGQSTEVQGKWKTVTGDKFDPKAVVFEILPNNSSNIRYFTKLDENKIIMLNKQMVEMKSSNYILAKQ